MWETWVQSLGWEDPLEEGKATHSSILAYAVHGVTKSGVTTERLSYGTTKILKHFKSLKNFSTFEIILDFQKSGHDSSESP